MGSREVNSREQRRSSREERAANGGMPSRFQDASDTMANRLAAARSQAQAQAYHGNQLFMVECSACGANFQVAAQPETARSVSIEARCLHCQQYVRFAVLGPSWSLDQQARTAAAEEKIIQEVMEKSKLAHLLEGLPREKYDSSRHIDYKECDLCMEDYRDGDELVRLPCMHLFHGHCVLPWLRKSCTCPACQMDVRDAVEGTSLEFPSLEDSS